MDRQGRAASAVPLCAALLLAMLPASHARAQQPARDTAAYLLPAITVKALGPAIPAASAPVALTATDRVGERPTDPDLSLATSLRTVPGVQVDNRYNFSLGDRISIRGFGARAQFGVRNITVLLDGIPLTLPDGQTDLSIVDPAFLGRIEAVRGPASAIYGNAAGGALLLETSPPPAHGGAGWLRYTGGGAGLRRLDGSAGLGWKGGGLRVDASRLDYAGFRQHQRTGSWHGHAVARLRPGAGELTLSADAVRYNAQSPGSLPDSLLLADPTRAYPLYITQATGERATAAQLGARWKAGLGPARLELAAWGRSRSVDNPIPSAIITIDRGLGGARATLHSGGGPVFWLLGGEAAVQSDLRRNYANDAGQRGALTLDQRERVRSASAFGRIYAGLGPVGLLAGVRYEDDAFRAQDHLITATNPNDSGTRDMHALSPMAGLRLTPLPGVNLYANVATAFETPTTSELANRPDGAGGFNPTLQPAHTVSYEAGARGDLSRHVRYDVAAYRARVTDALVPFQVPNAPGRDYFRNAGSTVHRGVEARLVLGVGGGWSATAAYTYTDVRFEHYVVAGTSYDGNRVPGVAPQRADLSLLYRFAVGGYLGLSADYSAAVPVDDANTMSADPYTLLGARLALPELGVGVGRVSPFVAIHNALDRRYVGSVVVNAYGGRYFEPGPGRTIYAGVSLRLGPIASSTGP